MVIDSGGLSAKDTAQVIVNPSLLLSEIILNSLTWNYWYDQNDSSGVNNEIYLSIPDTVNILTNSPLNIVVKLDSVGIWDPVNLFVNSHCSGGSYGYFIITTASNTLVLVIEPCSLNLNLIGTGTSVKINY